MLDASRTVLVVVDVQEKLTRVMPDPAGLADALGRLIRGAAVLELPVLWVEQNPDGLGPTVAALAKLLGGRPIVKRSFSCCGEPAFVEALAAAGRKQVLLAGIEAHVCIWQTAAELRAAGYEVEVPADATASRTALNKEVALGRIRAAGAGVTSVETALFELLGAAEGSKFKEILRIVK